MKVFYKKLFEKQLSDIIDFIAKDKIRANYEFAKKLEESILNISNAPYKYRKSIYFKDKNIRDMIYKGYTIVYRIKPR